MKRVYKYIIVITVCFTSATKSFPHESSPSTSITPEYILSSSSSSESPHTRENQVKMEATSRSQPNMSVEVPSKQHSEESNSYAEHKAMHDSKAMPKFSELRGEQRNKRHVHLDIGHHHHIPFRFGYGHGSHEHDYHHHHIGYNNGHHHHHHDDHWH